jgi:hypothetical protein
MNQFGNDQACDNCGDEWAELDHRTLCSECAEVLDDPRQAIRSRQNHPTNYLKETR